MKNSGQVTTSVLIWGVGMIASAIIGLSGYFVSEKNTIVKDVVAVKADVAVKSERISVVETDIRNIKESQIRIEKKLDLLSENLLKKR